MPRCLLVFEPPDGGVAEHVLRLATSLPRYGWTAEVAGPAEAIVYPELERAGVPLTRLPIGRKLSPLAYARGLASLTRLARSGRYDLLHVHSSKAGAIGRVAARAARVPVVYTPHCFAFIGPQRALRSALAVAAERALAAITGAIVCVADAERREALRHHVGRPDRLRVVHNGCPDCEEGLDPDLELEAFAAGGPLVACLTVLRPQKAVEVFVRAAPRVLQRVPEARLAVIGDGELRPGLEQLAQKLGLGERLRFFDFKGPASRQLRSLDVFILPSAWEAFPISVLEAMACGVPQVATDVGGTSEAIAHGETGLLCPPGDPEALAERIATLLADPKRRRSMARASVERHRANFGLDPMVEGIVEVYGDIVGPAPAATVSA